MKYFKKVQVLLVFLFLSNTLQIFSQTDPADPIFEIKNDLNQTVFAVYPGGVKIFIDDQLKAAGGGFTVGRLNTGKATAGDIFSVAPNNVNVFIDDGLKAAGGGFTVGRLNTGKADGVQENFLSVTPDSTRVYINETSSAGFAVGKLGTAETGLQNFMYLKKDNYFIGHNSGRLTTGLYNLFLGYESGFSNTTGNNNTFLGYQTGYSNISGYNNVFLGSSTCKSTIGSSQNVAIGNSCASDVSSTITSSVIMGDNALTGMFKSIPVTSSMFIGKNAGINIGEEGSSLVSNCIFLGTNAGDGIKNTDYSSISSIVAVGNNSGQNSDGYRNVFIGNSAGSQFKGHQNTMIGYSVGTQGGSGTYNVYIGDQVALQSNGSSNTYIGRTAGCWVNGDYNVFLGYNAGRASNISPREESSRLRIGANNLIYGEFDNRRVVINGTTTNGYNFYVNGTAGGSSAWENLSDKRLKKDISTISNPLEKVMALRGVNFYWKDNEKGNKLQMGFIAQETDLVIPEVVNKKSEHYSMQYAPITAVLVEAVKEQQEIINKLESRINELEKKNESLTSEVSGFKSLKAELDELKTLVKEVVKTQNANNTAEADK
ncbi:MAG: hypothetical protein DRJ10_05135 [Bacteroidetes bacterium]|nr:MAG: hypothetical protein DRJ10_05135 [Bacteroidota bacterium]